jgi:hypothetical protein
LYRLDDVVAWRAKRDATSQALGSSLAIERARRERAAAALAEQLHQTRAGALIPLAVAEAVWGKHIHAVRQRLLSWSTTLVDRVHRASTNDGLAGVERTLDLAVREVLSELAAHPLGGAEEGDDAAEKATDPDTSH